MTQTEEKRYLLARPIEGLIMGEIITEDIYRQNITSAEIQKLDDYHIRSVEFDEEDILIFYKDIRTKNYCSRPKRNLGFFSVISKENALKALVLEKHSLEERYLFSSLTKIC